jgi:replicative DNA helicase
MSIGQIKRLSDIHIDKSVIEKTYIRSYIKEVSKVLNYYNRGNLVILSAKTGSGKTTILAQEIAMFLDQNMKIASFSGELSDMKFKFWLYKILAGRHNLQYVYDKYLDQKTAYISKETENKITNFYKNNLYLIDYEHGLANEDDLIEKFYYLHNEHGVDVFTIDNQMMIEIDEGVDKWETRARTIQKFKTLAEKTKGIVFLVIHPRKVVDKMRIEDIAGQQDITAKADVVMIAHRVSPEVKSKTEINGIENPLYNIDGVLDIAKNREEGVLASIRLKYCSASKRLYGATEDDKLDYKFLWETQENEKNIFDI